MIRKPNFLARTAVVYRNYGFAISITIVATIQTNPHLCADNAIAQPAGRGVPGEQITGVYRNGCSATAKTIVVTVRMNFPPTVRNAIRHPTSIARTIGVYRKDGFAISKTIAATTRTSPRTCVKDCTDSVRNLNFSVPTASASRDNGDAIMTTIAETIPTKLIAVNSIAKTALSSATAAIASRRISAVTATGIVEISVTRSDVLLGIPKAGFVQSPNSSAKPLSYVYLTRKFVTAKTIVVMAPTKCPNSAVSRYGLVFII